MEEITMVALGAGLGEVGTEAILLDPELREGDERTKRFQAAAIKIYGKGPFEIKRISKDIAAGEYMVHLNIPCNKNIIMPATSLAEVI